MEILVESDPRVTRALDIDGLQKVGHVILML